MRGILLGYIPSIAAAALAVGGVLIHWIKKPSDLERADLLSRLANEAAALILSSNPKAPYAQLLQQLVSHLSQAPAVPTDNGDAIKRAAAAALVAQGVKPA